ncbi:MAG: TolC family protein, partial [Nitrospinae bacterium]|nr:TolC family protein [Nitrospinota bacterium]
LNSKSDYLVGLSYSQRDSLYGMKRSDFIGVDVSMTLPFFQNKARSAEVKEFAHREIAIEKQWEDAEHKLRSTINAKVHHIQKIEQEIELYAQKIIPQKSQSLESAISNYQTDRIDFLFLLKIEMELLMDRINLAHLLFQHESALSGLEEDSAMQLETVKKNVMEVKQ